MRDNKIELLFNKKNDQTLQINDGNKNLIEKHLQTTKLELIKSFSKISLISSSSYNKKLISEPEINKNKQANNYEREMSSIPTEQLQQKSRRRQLNPRVNNLDFFIHLIFSS
jgi:hypothetical protein